MIETQNTSPDPDFREQLQGWLHFVKRATRFWRVPLLTVALGSMALGIFLHFRTPKYRSETVILYIERVQPGEPGSGSGAERSVTVRLRELLMSRPKLEAVVTKFDLYPDLRRNYGMVDAVEELKKRIDFRAPGGDTFSIAFEGESPPGAQRVTAELARLVIDEDSKLRKGQAKVTLEFLSTEKSSTETLLAAAEQKLAGFMAEHPRFALDATPLANGAAIRASLGQAEVTPPQRSFAAAAPPARAAFGGGERQPLSTGASPSVAPGGGATDAEEARARAALAAAQENLTEKLTRYTTAHPDVKAADAAVGRAKERLATLSAGAVAGARASDNGQGVTSARPGSGPGSEPQNVAPVAVAPPAPVAVAPLAPVGRRTGALAGAGAVSAPPAHGQNLVDLETQWLQLTRAVTEARQRRDQIETKLFRADMQEGSEAVGHGVHVNVIDPAFLPERAQPPGRTTIALMFLVAALVLGALAALALAAMDERIFIARDAAGILPILTEVPSLQRRARVAS